MVGKTDSFWGTALMGEFSCSVFQSWGPSQGLALILVSLWLMFVFGSYMVAMLSQIGPKLLSLLGG